jgi:S-adenosylmethionine synthetase
VHTVVISTQHLAKASLEEVRRDVMEHVIKTVIPAKYMDSNTIFHINPCGLFIYGGPMVCQRIYTFIAILFIDCFPFSG